MAAAERPQVDLVGAWVLWDAGAAVVRGKEVVGQRGRETGAWEREMDGEMDWEPVLVGRIGFGGWGLAAALWVAMGDMAREEGGWEEVTVACWVRVGLATAR